MCGPVGGLDTILEHSNILNTGIISLGTEPPPPAVNFKKFL